MLAFMDADTGELHTAPTGAREEAGRSYRELAA